ncbi:MULTISPECIES: ComEC/Rec2 family competence protein [unclassified Ensifer]|nr:MULTISPECIES: ComEC/Rec2 family competence protein [unclassified Ensifer]OCP01071.1 transporter [Ensifer sp. LC11]OCP01642.1 transporter [Ensifer sp. LC13]OCP02190.1 transporter [Ensifer sp. LC14]OCP30208.1 transporter [Ensifer sp. LC499]
MVSLRAAVEEERAFGHGFVLVPVLLTFGVLAWLALPFDAGITKLALLLCIFGMAAVACRGKLALLRAPLIAMTLLTAGMLLMAIETARVDTIVLDAPVTTNVRGAVLSREQDDRGRWRYGIEVQQTSRPHLRRQPLKVTLVTRGSGDPFPVGALIEGRARLSPPSGPALPGLNDFAFDSYFKGIGAVGFFYGAPKRYEDAATEGRGATTSIRSAVAAKIAAMRETVGERIRAAIGGDTGALAAALVTAEERAISRETVEVLRQAGLAHVLAISGLNMALAAGTFLIGARTMLSMIPGLAPRLPIKKIAAAGALLMVCLYILISGGAVSALRAWIMISIMLVAVFFDRMSISLRNVALAALVIVAFTPSAVAGPGFQMSFAATLALVAGYARWRERRAGDTDVGGGRTKGRLVAGVAMGVFVTSLIGGLATAVYSIAYFHRLPAYGLLANILTMPLISVVVMPFGLFAMLLMPFGLEHYPLVAMAWGLDRMLDVARFVTSFDGEVVTGRIGHLGFVLIAAGGVLLCVLRTWLALSGAVLVVAGLVSLAFGDGRQPDIVIAEDGRLVGVVTNGTIATNRSRPSDFVFSQWQRALAAKKHLPPVMLTSANPGLYPAGDVPVKSMPPLDREQAAAVRAELSTAIEENAVGAFACREKQWCAARTGIGWTIITLENPRLFQALCDQADLVVIAARVDIDLCPANRARIIDAQTLRRTGAVEIRAQPMEAQGPPAMQFRPAFTALDRPWERHRAYDWRSGAFIADPPAF